MEEKSFIYKDYRCTIKLYWNSYRQWYCGYVSLPIGHKFYAIDYDKIPVNCHGGLTYSKFHLDGWRIGFDCNHHNDRITVQNKKYVISECMKIVDQLEILNGLS